MILLPEPKSDIGAILLVAIAGMWILPIIPMCIAFLVYNATNYLFGYNELNTIIFVFMIFIWILIPAWLHANKNTEQIKR